MPNNPPMWPKDSPWAFDPYTAPDWMIIYLAHLAWLTGMVVDTFYNKSTKAKLPEPLPRANGEPVRFTWGQFKETWLATGSIYTRGSGQE